MKMPPLSFQIIRQPAVGNVYAVLSVPLSFNIYGLKNLTQGGEVLSTFVANSLELQAKTTNE